MSIDDMIPRERVLESLVKLEKISENQKNAADVLGHDMYMKSFYAHSYISREFNIGYDELREYREKDDKQLELDFYKTE